MDHWSGGVATTTPLAIGEIPGQFVRLRTAPAGPGALDVEIRTEENYRACQRNHVLSRWGHAALGDITALDVATWLKQLRAVTPPQPSPPIRCVFAMLLDDAIAQHRIPTSPLRQHRRRGRHRDHVDLRRGVITIDPEHGPLPGSVAVGRDSGTVSARGSKAGCGCQADQGCAPSRSA
jgi:hypothetical protein